MSRALVVKLALAAMLLLGLATLLALGYDVRRFVQLMLDLLRAAGPVTFFLAMALLPAVGAPLTFFSITAGSVFGPQLGMAAVMLLSLAAITVNIALGYLLASHAMRPLLEYALKRLGYQLPRVESGDATSLIVLLRVTPGLPFPVQNYLLGLAGVPFIRYVLVSCAIALPLNAAIIFFGEALLQGRGRMALVGLLVILALAAAIHLVRRRYRAVRDRSK